MKAILIDPRDRTVTEVERPGKSYKEINALIGADLFDVVRLGNGHVIYVDDEGLINGRINRDGCYMLKSTAQRHSCLLVGPGLVCGTTVDGDKAPGLTVEQVRSMIDWVQAIQDGRVYGVDGEYDL